MKGVACVVATAMAPASLWAASAPTSLASAPLPYKPADDTALLTTPQWGLAFLLCGAALVAALLALRRHGHRPARRRSVGMLQVVETRPLSAHTQLAVVQYRGRQLLLSIGPGGTQCLRDDPSPTEAPS